MTDLNTEIEWHCRYNPDDANFPGWLYTGYIHSCEILVYRRGQDMSWQFTIGVFRGKRRGFFVYRSEFDNRYIAPTDIHEVLLTAADRIFVAVQP